MGTCLAITSMYGIVHSQYRAVEGDRLCFRLCGFIHMAQQHPEQTALTCPDLPSALFKSLLMR